MSEFRPFALLDLLADPLGDVLRKSCEQRSSIDLLDRSSRDGGGGVEAGRSGVEEVDGTGRLDRRDGTACIGRSFKGDIVDDFGDFGERLASMQRGESREVILAEGGSSRHHMSVLVLRVDE